jgi:hypothetical protein
VARFLFFSVQKSATHPTQSFFISVNIVVVKTIFLSRSINSETPIYAPGRSFVASFNVVF